MKSMIATLFIFLCPSVIASPDLYLGALLKKSPMKIQDIKTLELIFTPKKQLSIQLEGLACLTTDSEFWWDEGQTQYELPQQSYKLEETQDGEYLISVQSSQAPAIEIGYVHSNGRIEMSRNSSLLFDQLRSTPGILVKNSQGQVSSREIEQRQNFRKLYQSQE